MLFLLLQVTSSLSFRVVDYTGKDLDAYESDFIDDEAKEEGEAEEDGKLSDEDGEGGEEEGEEEGLVESEDEAEDNVPKGEGRDGSEEEHEEEVEIVDRKGKGKAKSEAGAKVDVKGKGKFVFSEDEVASEDDNVEVAEDDEVKEGGNGGSEELVLSEGEVEEDAEVAEEDVQGKLVFIFERCF